MYVINLRFVGACITLFIVAGICAALFGKFGFQVFFLLCLYWFFRKFLSDGGTIIAILFLMVLCGGGPILLSAAVSLFLIALLGVVCIIALMGFWVALTKKRHES
ncbi:TPA: hypothetical protein ACIZMV_000573 [Streptococcus agalactiae]|uniref:hypothetical protein n=1 Tax=Streptococcus agalactiae TaxID=1311 RepID=UPI0013FE2CB7|nr:hypothetical protein [Streptococcus agalactiae]MDX5010659.1 hypothetical protein [Streptococcus agalactiae]HEM9182237.1 hypothetical protein [Streptococcus agalactiae]HEN4541676.1 hypothetical protein [Streptococcus agalactiae]HEN4583266.1 hypothetical protein [Streptococcus agalactiae]HEO4623421.1 hypothetical protein [Streptococcus agalactiae]